MSLARPADTYTEDLHRYEWSNDGISFVLERFHEERSDIRCELTVEGFGGQLYYGRLLLLGPNSRRDVARHLHERDDAPDWVGMLEQACTLSVRRYREGPPAIDLWADDVGAPARHLVRPYIVDQAINLIYGQGDSGKSLLADTLAVVVATGAEIAGIEAERTGNVLYCDWEDSAASHQERIRAVSTGANVEPPAGGIIYRRMSASLKEAAREIRKDIAAHHVQLVVIDSLGMACGGDPNDAGAVIEAMVAARGLGVSVLAVHHIAKGVKDKSTPYGSVYASNEARSTFYMEAQREGGQLSAVLTNYKSNRGPRSERTSFRWTFTEDEYERVTRIEVMSLTFGEQMKSGVAPGKWRILEALKAGPLTRQQLREATNLPVNTIKQALQRGKGEFFTLLEDGLWALLEGRVQENMYPPVPVPDVSGYSPPPIGGQVHVPGPVPASEEDADQEEEAAPVQPPPWWIDNDGNERLDSLQGMG